MNTKILLVGVLDTVLAEAQRQAEGPQVEFFRGTSLADVRATLARVNIDHVFMGAGLDLETRLEIVREIFQSSNATTVHMKDRASGPQGFLPFVRAVLGGLQGEKA